MADRDDYIPGVPCWVDSNQPHPEAAADFYRGLFGWDIQDVMPPGAHGSYLVARLRGRDVAAIASIPDGAPPAAAWNTYVWVDSADDAAAKVKAAGGRILTEPFEVTGAGTMAVFADPDGAVFRVWEARGHRGAGIVNEPGSVVFNDLRTRDPERAAAFYRAVFGWDTLAVGGPGQAWRLPGYGDFLQRSDPDLRKRMAEGGAPEGFEDVVATLTATTASGQGDASGQDDVTGQGDPAGQSDPARRGDVAAHWGVTFAVADADATAERAAELGGTVLAAPFDAPWVRMAVIADPAGAVFTASRFAPENRDVGQRAESGAAAA